MHQRPHDPTCSTEAIGGNHILRPGAGLHVQGIRRHHSDPWFKASQFGCDAGNKTWGTDLLNRDCGKYTFTLPSEIPGGLSGSGGVYRVACWRIRLIIRGCRLTSVEVRSRSAASRSGCDNTELLLRTESRPRPQDTAAWVAIGLECHTSPPPRLSFSGPKAESCMFQQQHLCRPRLANTSDHWCHQTALHGIR
jgi:hypothetical protein